MEKAFWIVQDVFELRRQVKGHDTSLRDLAALQNSTMRDVRQLSDRVLSLELRLQHLDEKQATERENFRLQLENLVLRAATRVATG